MKKKKKKLINFVLISMFLTSCSNKIETTETDNYKAESSVQSSQQTQSSSSSEIKSQEEKSTESQNPQAGLNITQTKTITGRSSAVETSDPNSQNALTPALTQTDEAATYEETLADYDDLSIEYARIYIQLGDNPDIETIYVDIIPAGELINPYIENGAVYPETVTRITGSRNIDGIITYSSNGDGTINLYNVPHTRFHRPNYDLMSEDEYIDYTYEIANNPQTVYVDPASDELVLDYIHRLSYLK